MKLKNWFKKYWLVFLIIGILTIVFFPKYCGFSYGGLLKADAILKREGCNCLGIKYGTSGGRFNLWRILDGGEVHFCIGIPLGRTCFEWVANETNDFSSEKQTECKRAEPRCGIENCHGFKIPCGPNVPEICSEIYMHGDFCRQYVKCEVINGVCQLVKSEKFEKCKSCVEKCSEDFKDKFLKLSECESKCRAALTLEDKVIIRQVGGVGLLSVNCREENYINNVADYIIEGIVEKVESKQTEEGIFTFSDLRIEKYLKGTPFPQDELQIAILGGTVGELGLAVEDQPIFHQGKKVRIYFKKTNGEFFIICGQMGAVEI